MTLEPTFLSPLLKVIINLLETLATINIYPEYNAWNIANVFFYALWMLYAFIVLRQKFSFFKSMFFSIIFSFAWISFIDEVWFLLNIKNILGKPLVVFLERWIWKLFYCYFAFKYARQYFGDLLQLSRKFWFYQGLLFSSLLIPLLVFNPYSIKNFQGAPYPLWIMYVFGDLLQWGLNTLGFFALWKHPSYREHTPILNVREFIRLGKGTFQSLKDKPGNVTIFHSIINFQLLFDAITKTLRLLHINFNKHYVSNMNPLVQTDYLGTPLRFHWNERAEVYSTINKLDKQVYGAPMEGTVIDVGSHIGITSLYFLQLAERVIAIEPLPSNFDLLEENVKDKNVVCLNLAISKENSYRKLYLGKISSSNSLLPEMGSKKYVTVETRSLDQIIEQIKEPISLVKIDVEGTELEVLKSCARALEEKRIHMLVVASYHYPKERFEVEQYLNKMGYATIVDKTLEVIVFGVNKENV